MLLHLETNPIVTLSQAKPGFIHLKKQGGSIKALSTPLDEN
jgi:hypothetical protein